MKSNIPSTHGKPFACEVWTQFWRAVAMVSLPGVVAMTALLSSI